ncbi:MAG: hypothetical protein AB9880_08570 [Christensenellales bacterium]
MFGKRPDGRVVKSVDPIIALTPYLMPMRCDAQVMLNYKVDYEKLARYIVRKGAEGHKLSFMDIIFAAYVRTVSQQPELNRFIANKRIYARNELAISFVVLKDTKDGSVQENTMKCKFDPHDTLFDVAARTAAAVTAGRNEEVDNSTLKVAKFLLNPLLANTISLLARGLDRYGLLPRFIHEASPFHTSMFFTNMASIGMPAVNHHIYNFGTTSLFVSIGTVERSVIINEQGEPQRKRMLPSGITADERVGAGMIYAKMVATLSRYLAEPELLEIPPERVYYDEGVYYGLPPAPRVKRLRRIREFARPRRRKSGEGAA